MYDGSTNLDRKKKEARNCVNVDREALLLTLIADNFLAKYSSNTLYYGQVFSAIVSK